MTHTPNTMSFMEHQNNMDVEISMLPPSPSPTKKVHRPSVNRFCNSTFLGFKPSDLFLILAIGIILVIELKIMYETTRTYNESLVKQLSSKNEMLERTLMNLTSTTNDRNALLDKLLKLNEDFKMDAMNRSDKVEDKMDETQQLVIQLAKENKVMYSNGEKNFMETLKLVREALTMNTNTVIRLLDENNEIQNKVNHLEETVSFLQRHEANAWTNRSSKSAVSITEFLIVILLSLLTI